MGKTEEQIEQAAPEAAIEVHPTNLATALAVCTGGWLIPGLGHMLLGRWVRGLIFTACIAAMFLFGLAMQGKLYDLAIEQPLHIFAFMADAGAGLPYLIAQLRGWGAGNMATRTYDYGTTYLWVSGLLNYLIVLDAFDIARGRKR